MYACVLCDTEHVLQDISKNTIFVLCVELSRNLGYSLPCRMWPLIHEYVGGIYNGSFA
jgi:hypothetical protein